MGQNTFRGVASVTALLLLIVGCGTATSGDNYTTTPPQIKAAPVSMSTPTSQAATVDPDAFVAVFNDEDWSPAFLATDGRKRISVANMDTHDVEVYVPKDTLESFRLKAGATETIVFGVPGVYEIYVVTGFSKTTLTVDTRSEADLQAVAVKADLNDRHPDEHVAHFFDTYRSVIRMEYVIDGEQISISGFSSVVGPDTFYCTVYMGSGLFAVEEEVLGGPEGVVVLNEWGEEVFVADVEMYEFLCGVRSTYLDLSALEDGVSEPLERRVYGEEASRVTLDIEFDDGTVGFDAIPMSGEVVITEAGWMSEFTFGLDLDSDDLAGLFGASDLGSVEMDFEMEFEMRASYFDLGDPSVVDDIPPAIGNEFLSA